MGIPAFRVTTVIKGVSGIYDSDWDNQPVMLSCSNSDGDFTGGDAGNGLVVTIWYVLVDLT